MAQRNRSLRRAAGRPDVSHRALNEAVRSGIIERRGDWCRLARYPVRTHGGCFWVDPLGTMAYAKSNDIGWTIWEYGHGRNSGIVDKKGKPKTELIAGLQQGF